MKKLIFNIIIYSLSFGIFSYTNATEPQQNNEVKAWKYSCKGDGDTSYCDIVQSLVDNETKNERFRFAIVKKIKNSKYGLLIKVPLGFRLDTGVAIRIDDKLPKNLEKIVFSRCFSDGCYAETAINENDIKILSNAKKIEVIVLNLNGTPEFINIYTKDLNTNLKVLRAQ